MIFPMSNYLYGYDVFPKVIIAGKETAIHIRPLGEEVKFEAGKTYPLEIWAFTGGEPNQYPASSNIVKTTVTVENDGCMTVKHTFPCEQEYCLHFINPENGNNAENFYVYCIEEDLKGLYPLRGDLHMHTLRSDGSQEPAVVAANYHREGLDFFAITDHRRYYPSLEAIDAYKDVPVEFLIVPGEEVHPQDINEHNIGFHYVNFGGEYSINALVEGSDAAEKGTDKKYRSIIENCPGIMRHEEYVSQMLSLADEIGDVPENIDAINAAVMKWEYDEIHKANGLAIFPHPTWRCSWNKVYNVPDVFSDYITEKGYFDAFEVLGGETYFQHNGFQTIKYYEDREKGLRYPVVGSTDSHDSYPTSRGAHICSTIVFAPENERRAIIDAIKDFRSIAVDTISREYRLVGESRLVRYACFLVENYLPLHDELCCEEGRLMKQYVTGTAEERQEAAEWLKAISGRIDRQRKKYFDF